VPTPPGAPLEWECTRPRQSPPHGYRRLRPGTHSAGLR
jgi:hypothetical protein